MYLALIFKILSIHALAVASPGPDFLVVTKNSLNHSRKIGIWTAIGIALGIGVHIIYGIGGIAILIAQNETLYNVIKFIGALYIVYMAIMSFGAVKKRKVIEKDAKKLVAMNSVAAFKNGFITNVLNPKATMFFLSIFSVLIPANTPIYILVIIGLLLILNTGLWFVVVAILFTQEKVQTLFYKYEHSINIVFGIILLLLAVKILFF